MSVWGRIFLLAFASVALLAGCGGDDSIPQEDGETLLTRLDEVEGAVQQGVCDNAQDSANLLVTQVDELPDDVDSDVRELLERGVERLAQLTSEQCEPREEPEVDEPPVVEPEPEPPVEVEPEEEPDEEEPPDDDEDRGDGNRGGRGGGQGGGGNRGTARGGGGDRNGGGNQGTDGEDGGVSSGGAGRRDG